MDVLTAIEKRREITSFKDQQIPQETMEQLITSLYLSPSGNNLPSREFIAITDRAVLQDLSQTTPYMKWLQQASAGFVIVGNAGLSKYWLQDATIAASYLWLAATSLGLGAAWGAVYHSEDTTESLQRESYVRQQLDIPEHLRVVAIIGVGYAAEEPAPKQLYPLESVLHQARYVRKDG